MSQKNDTVPLLLSLAVTGVLIAGGVWWLSSHFSIGTSGNSTNSTSTGNSTLDARLSAGEKLLFSPGANSQAAQQKQAGAQAIAAQQYSQATTAFTNALQANKNDPEALIYLNNARIGAGKAYTIAVCVPIDSDLDGSLEILRGVAQAQDDINQSGGIAGVPLKVVIANDGNSPDTAQQIAAQLVQDTAVLGVVGHYASDVTLAAAAVYNKGGLVAISPVSTSVKLSNYGHFIFRTVPSDFVAARALAEYMVTRAHQQKAAVFYNSQSGYSQSLHSEFSSALALSGGQVVSEFDLANDSFNAADSFQQATQQGATALVLLPNSGKLDRVLQVVQINKRQLTMLAGDDVYAPKTLAVGGAEAVGMVVAVPWHILANPNTPFVQTSRKLWGGDVNWRTATAYDAAEALIAGLKQTPTRQGIQAALSASNFSSTGGTGTVRFLPSGDRNQSVQLVTVVRGSRSGLGFDFQPVP